MRTFSRPPEIPSASVGIYGGSVSSGISSMRHIDLQVSAT